MLIGRERERDTLCRLVDEARSGAGGALVLRGEPGVGKSTLLEDAVARAHGMRVVRSVGVEAESAIAFGAVDRAVRPLRRAVASLPEPQRRLLGLAPAGSEPPDRFAVALALLAALAVAAEDLPLLLVVDDAHLVDRPSAEALAFVGRRLAAEPVLLLAAARDDADARRSFPAEGLPELRLDGLGVEDAASLCAAFGNVAPRVAGQLARLAAGNPLALAEAVGALTPEQRAGRATMPALVPTGRGIEDAYGRRVAALPAAARTALLVAAASNDEHLSVIGAALERLDVTLAAFDAVADSELARLRDGAVVFRHGLVRSAVYHSSPAGERRAAHAALAAALESAGDDDRAAWHRAAAAAGPDEATASALVRSAERAAQRGGYDAAAAALRVAAGLTTDPPARVERLLAAGDAARYAGRGDDAVALLDEVRRSTDDAAVRARALFAQGQVELMRHPGSAPPLFLGAASLLTSAEDAASAVALAIGAATAAGHFARAVEISERLGDVFGADEPAARAGRAMALLYAGRVAEGAAVLADLAVDPRELFGDDLQTLGEWAFCLSVADRHAEALALLDEAVGAARAGGQLAVLAQLCELRAGILYENARWAGAEVLAEEALGLSREIGLGNTRSWVLATLSFLRAAQGRLDDLREVGSEALAVAAPLGMAEIPVAVASAFGVHALGVDDVAEAIRQLEEAERIAEENGGYQPVLSRWWPNLVEAYVRAGRTDDARRLYGRHAGAAGDVAYLVAEEARLRALLAPADGFDEDFELALDRHAATVNSFERARTALLYGERLRRARRRADARAPLAEAFATFDRLGARPWAARAATELEAAGAAVEQSEPKPLADLTPHELRIAAAVASGAKNVEIAARLFVTPKTVEFHLRNIFRKLDVRSRTELAGLYAAAAPAL